jgi:hypothetical protein
VCDGGATCCGETGVAREVSLSDLKLFWGSPWHAGLDMNDQKREARLNCREGQQRQGRNCDVWEMKVGMGWTKLGAGAPCTVVARPADPRRTSQATISRSAVLWGGAWTETLSRCLASRARCHSGFTSLVTPSPRQLTRSTSGAAKFGSRSQTLRGEQPRKGQLI